MTTATALIDDMQQYASGWRPLLEGFLNDLRSYGLAEFTVNEVLAGHQPIDNITALMANMLTGIPVKPSTAVDLSAPTFVYNETAYQSDLLTAEIAKLLADLEGGSYGIDTADEALLLDRAQDREVGLANQAIDEVERSFVSRGFGIPPGTMYGALEKVQQGRQDAVSTLSRDIYVKRADQFVQARQFTIQQSMALENILIQKHANLMIRILQAAQSQLQAKIAAVSAQIDEAKLSIDAYATDGQVYGARANAAQAVATVAVGSYEANNRAFLGVVEQRIANEKLQLEAAIAGANLRATTAEAGASVIATAIAGALNSTNGIVTVDSES